MLLIGFSQFSQGIITTSSSLPVVVLEEALAADPAVYDEALADVLA